MVAEEDVKRTSVSNVMRERELKRRTWQISKIFNLRVYTWLPIEGYEKSYLDSKQKHAQVRRLHTGRRGRPARLFDNRLLNISFFFYKPLVGFQSDNRYTGQRVTYSITTDDCTFRRAGDFYMTFVKFMPVTFLADKLHASVRSPVAKSR
jgi:hypothetical protein